MTKDLQAAIKASGIAASDITTDTYFYVTDAGQTDYMQKSDRFSRPADEAQMIGYVGAHANLADARALARK